MYPLVQGVQLTRALGRSAWGVSFSPTYFASKGITMAEPLSSIQFEDIPIEEARRMGRGPRMDPQPYQELKTRLTALSSQAVHMTIPEGTSPTTMKNRILRMASELRIPVTIRKVPGGLLFWRSTDEDVQQAKEVVGRLQSAQRQGARPGRRRRG
jgi:hypothetical protein